ncbi:hypothetical protein [Streptomyces sp. bgisy060]|uniref:hypothetical protein n=1 Tax=Streptomyces sp. bgisy060 TaxID=3413775 RepID=UPI003EBC9C6E
MRGHSLELVFDNDTVEVGQYDRDNGAGLAEKVLARLRETGEVTPPSQIGGLTRAKGRFPAGCA